MLGVGQAEDAPPRLLDPALEVDRLEEMGVVEVHLLARDVGHLVDVPRAAEGDVGLRPAPSGAARTRPMACICSLGARSGSARGGCACPWSRPAGTPPCARPSARGAGAACCRRGRSTRSGGVSPGREPRRVVDQDLGEGLPARVGHGGSRPRRGPIAGVGTWRRSIVRQRNCGAESTSAPQFVLEMSRRIRDWEPARPRAWQG